MATITAIASGDWTDNSTWDLDRAPQGSDAVDLSSYTITITSDVFVASIAAGSGMIQVDGTSPVTIAAALDRTVAGPPIVQVSATVPGLTIIGDVTGVVGQGPPLIYFQGDTTAFTYYGKAVHYSILVGANTMASVDLTLLQGSYFNPPSMVSMLQITGGACPVTLRGYLNLGTTASINGYDMPITYALADLVQLGGLRLWQNNPQFNSDVLSSPLNKLYHLPPK